MFSVGSNFHSIQAVFPMDPELKKPQNVKRYYGLSMVSLTPDPPESWQLWVLNRCSKSVKCHDTSVVVSWHYDTDTATLIIKMWNFFSRQELVGVLCASFFKFWQEVMIFHILVKIDDFFKFQQKMMIFQILGRFNK